VGSVVASSPTHERRRGEGHGGASPARGRHRGRARGVDGGARMARLPRLRRRRRRRKGTRAVDGGVAKSVAQRLTGGDGDVRTIDEWRLHRRTGGGGEASAGCQDGGAVSFRQRRSATREVRRPVAAAFVQRSCRNGVVGQRLYGAGVRHKRGVCQPRGESTLTGGPGTGSGG
jgi:hypothetical protein